MSYDLYFYKRKTSNLTESKIAEYLTRTLISASESNTQWFVKDEDTETYFSFDQNEPETDEESIELFENYKDFDYTHLTFNINFLRPDFFGQFAFEFVDKFVKELDLFVLNPQSSADPDNPIKPKDKALYENWSEINATHSINYFNEHELEYFPLEKSNEYYQYNLNRNKLQQKLGDDYFVPKMMLCKGKTDGEIITVSTWTQHIANVFPPADYFILGKKYKKSLFKKVEEDVFISAKTLNERFGHLFNDFEFKGCKIINPESAKKAKDIFNTTQTIEQEIFDYLIKIPIEKIVNFKPIE